MKTLLLLALFGFNLLMASSREEIVLTTIEDENLTFSSTQKGIDFGKYRGKIVILDFMHTGCPPCFKEIEHLIALQEKYPKKLQVISLVLDKHKSNEDIQTLMELHDVNYVVTNSPANQAFADALGGVSMFPTLMIFDQEGAYLNDYRGVVSEATLEGDIEMALD